MNQAKAKNALIASIQSAGAPHHPYMLENDRWLDLVLLLLIDGAGLTKPQALIIARHLGAERLPKGKHHKQQLALRGEFDAMIRARDFDHRRMDAIAQVIQNTAAAIKKRYGGGIQSFLRSYGEKMVRELAKVLRNSGLTESKSRRVATVWLQNVANMPLLSAQGDHVKAFCKKNGITASQLFKLADELGINVAYIDDVLLIQHSASASKNRRKKRRAPSKST